MLENLKSTLVELKLWEPFIAGINIFIPTMAMVYLFGRMLEVTKTNRSKNVVALITIIASSSLITIFKNNQIFWNIWDMYFLGCIGILFYVLVGFTLYQRIAAFFDKFITIRKEKKARKIATKAAAKEKRKNG
mgnify:CR=1 FL=1